ncbi:acyl-CoA N-acyltransferase [Wilcoxina mikolae CBS 423.85]|nr:acyl-CoA N-acyltransferase [Wilcoxina mikolae CBS 423.85]
MSDCRLNITSLSFTRIPSKKLRSSELLLTAVKQVEKHTFPSNEVFDFDNEIKKRTTSLYCVYRQENDGCVELCSYAVYIRTKLVTRIHKVCVVERYRRQGIGKWMMERLLRELMKASATNVDLWVDTSRIPARQLYLSCGFLEMETVRDYYSPNRDGIRMELKLAGRIN